MSMDMSMDMNSSMIESNGKTFTRTDYNGISVLVDEDGFYNASKICKDNGTKLANITRNQYWKDYIKVLSSRLTNEPRDLSINRLNTDGYSREVQGVYVHPKLVNWLCMHLDYMYAIKVGEIMDLINERLHLLNTSLQEEIDTLKQENQTLQERVDLLDQKVSDAYDVNLVLHENTSNLMHDVNDLKPRAVPAGTNNKLLRIMIEDATGLYKITANSFWTDDRFEEDGYTVIKHYRFPASMNVRQILKNCSYIKRLYFEHKHLDEICEIIKNSKPLEEW